MYREEKLSHDEVVKILEKHHMWTGKPEYVIDVRKENEALITAIRSIKAWERVKNSINDQMSMLLKDGSEKSLQMREGLQNALNIVEEKMNMV